MLKKIYYLFDFIKKLGFSPSQCFIFGGTVRDRLFNRASPDLDILIESDIDFEELKRRLVNNSGVRVILNKQEFNYVKVLLKEPQRFLLDIQTAENHLDFLKKRDFTINSLAVNLRNSLSFFASGNTGFIVDVNEGLKDLKSRTLRPCSKDSFKEDPIRIFRACYFVCEFKLWPDPKIVELLSNADKLLANIKPEKAFGEFNKLFFKNPSCFARCMSVFGLDEIFTGKRYSADELKTIERLEGALRSPESKREKKIIKAAMLIVLNLHNLDFISCGLNRRTLALAEKIKQKLINNDDW